MQNFTVYQIIYVPTKEVVYIGCTKDIKIRWQGHRSSSSPHYIARFINRVGMDKFDIIEIQSFDNRDDAEALEGQLTAGIKPRCNLTADGGAGRGWTEKHRKKLSVRQKQSNAKMGKKLSKEHRQTNVCKQMFDTKRFLKHLKQLNRKQIYETIKVSEPTLYRRLHNPLTLSLEHFIALCDAMERDPEIYFPHPDLNKLKVALGYNEKEV